MKKEDAVVEIIDKVYDDAGKTAMKEVGNFFAAIAGFFNNVIAAPLHRLNAKFKIKTEAYIQNLYSEFKKIPEENRQEPALQILGPTFEALRFNLDDEALSELFTNLLTSSMDNRVASKCHPAYVRIIAQMDGTDAQVLNGIFEKRNGYFPMVAPRCLIKLNYQGRELDGYGINDEKFPDLYIGPIGDLTVFEISKSLYNLARLGIIEINKQFGMINDFVDVYKTLVESDQIKKIFNSPDVQSLPNCYLEFNKGRINFTEFGKDFAETVIK